MKVGALKERADNEFRVAMTPESAQQLAKLGHACLVETGAGLGAGVSDEAYRAAGVTLADSAAELFGAADR